MEKLAETNNTHHENVVESEARNGKHFSHAVQLVTSVSLPMVLFAAVRLKVFEIIAKAGKGKKLSAAQIVAQLPTTNSDAASMVDRMLLLLSTHSVLTCDVLETSEGPELGYLRVYGLAPVAEFFVPDEEGTSVGHMVELIQDKVLIDSWYGLEKAVLEGGEPPFNRVHGMHLYEYAGRNPGLINVIIKGVDGLTAVIIKQLVAEYKGFDGVQTLVDVGGGAGIVLHHIISKYPSMKAINFDLPQVVEHAPPFPGVEHIGGDMFDKVPKGDAIFMKNILHDWSDEHCIKVLKNCLTALPDQGKVIVVEFVVPMEADTSASSKKVCQVDMLSMTQSTGGKERSEYEFRSLAIAAGFRGIKLQYLSCDVGVIEMFKK